MRPLRSILAVILIAAYGPLSLLGPALHLLPGLGHRTSTSELTRQVGDRPTHACNTISPGDCLACHYVAQGQISAESPSVAWLYQTYRPIHCQTQSVLPVAPYR